MDHGVIEKATAQLLSAAEYNNSLETMELIAEGENCIIITPDKCKNNHVILVDEFIKSNLHQPEFMNPYTRNTVKFSTADLDHLTRLKKELIKTMHNDLHEIFVRFLKLGIYIPQISPINSTQNL